MQVNRHQITWINEVKRIVTMQAQIIVLIVGTWSAEVSETREKAIAPRSPP